MKRPSAWSYTWKVSGVLLLLVVLVLAGLLFYASSQHFENTVRHKVISVLEDATGGRVDLQALRWNALHFSVEVDGLTIHGLEGPGEVPYAHVDRLYARAKIISLFRAQLGLDFLEVDRPVVHLIIYPNGSTNQPTPKTREGMGDASLRTIFDLQAGRAEVHDGLVLVNQRALPFDLAANDVGVLVTYARDTGRYLGELKCEDITAKQGRAAAVRSQLQVRVEAAADALDLQALHFATGKTRLDASGTLHHFASPQWKGKLDGTVELPEISALGVVDGFRRGSADFAATGEGSGGGQFVLDGRAKLAGVTYSIPYVLIDGLNATTGFHVTPQEITLPDFVGRPRQGGIVTAAVRYANWAGRVPVMTIRARVREVLLSTVLYSVVARGYQDLGFDTLGEGPVDVDWTGEASDLTVAARLRMTNPQQTAPGELPLSGFVDAKYFQHGGRVEIKQLQAQSPGTLLNVTGSLGVYPIEEPSNLAVHLVNHDLGEFDRVLKTLDLGVAGKKGISGVPVQLHGDATFDGQATGSLVDPAFKGHVSASQFSTHVVIPAVGNKPAVSRNFSWDTLDATGSYSSRLISVEQAVLSRGKTVIHANGQLEAHAISRRRVAFDDDALLTATVQMQNATVGDLLAMVGQDLPVTGNLNFQAHAGGTLGDLAGTGSLAVQGGSLYGQPYHSLTGSLAVAGQDIHVTKLTLLQDGGTVIGNGTFNLKTRQFLANLDGSNFELAHLYQPKDVRLAVAGVVKFDAHASGTIDAPSVLAGIHLRNVVLGGQPAGALEVVVHTVGGEAFFTGQSSENMANLQVKGQTALSGNFDTKADVVLANLNIAPFLRGVSGTERVWQLVHRGHHSGSWAVEGAEAIHGRRSAHSLFRKSAGDRSASPGPAAGLVVRRYAASDIRSYYGAGYGFVGDRNCGLDGQPGARHDRGRIGQHEAGADLRS